MPLVPLLHQINPVHTCPTNFPKIHSNITFPSTPRLFEWSLPFSFSDKNNVCIFNLSHACYMSRPSHPPCLDPNNIWWSVQVMKLLIMQSSPASRHFLLKVKLSLCLTKHHAMKEYWEWRYSSMHSLTSALDGGEWSASRLGRFTPKERAPRTHWIGGWVGPRAGLDAVVKRNIPSPRRESKPRTPIVQPIAQRYTDWAITAQLFVHCDAQRCHLYK
jgi:hypothetical protein